MKKIILGCIALLMLGLGGCSSNTPSSEEIVEEGISRVVFNEDEEALLTLLGLNNNVWVYEYQVPQEVKTIKVDFMNLVDGEWVESKNGKHDVSDERNGKIAFRLNEDQVIHCSIQSDFGDVMLTNGFESLALSKLYSTKAWSFLEEFQEIEINKSIIIGIICYADDQVLRAFGTEQYDNVEVFENADFVQAIRVTFLTEEGNRT